MPTSRRKRSNLGARRDGQGRLTVDVQYVNYSKGGKIGGTAGFVVNAADNIGRLATCPAEQTASTFVVPVDGLKIGTKIKGFHANGQIESAGGIATVDVELRKLTAAAANLTDATVASATQLSVTADTIISRTNTGKTLSTAETVAEGTTYYILITVTTAALTDVDLMSVALHIDDSEVE